MTEEDMPPPVVRQRSLWPIAFAFVCIAAMGFLYLFWSDIKGAFGMGYDVSVEVREYLQSASAADGELLVAKVSGNETYKKDVESHIVLFGQQIPRDWYSVVLKAPVIFNYFVSIDGWHVEIHEADEIGVCEVLAPALEWMKPNVDISGLEILEDEQWIGFGIDQEQSKQQAQHEFATALNDRAKDHIASARPHAREAIQKFVSSWLLHDEKWSQKNYHIKVMFQDEATSSREL